MYYVFIQISNTTIQIIQIIIQVKRHSNLEKKVMHKYKTQNKHSKKQQNVLSNVKQMMVSILRSNLGKIRKEERRHQHQASPRA
jgi:hypothetical protein